MAAGPRGLQLCLSGREASKKDAEKRGAISCSAPRRSPTAALAGKRRRRGRLSQTDPREKAVHAAPPATVGFVFKNLPSASSCLAALGEGSALHPGLRGVEGHCQRTCQGEGREHQPSALPLPCHPPRGSPQGQPSPPPWERRLAGALCVLADPAGSPTPPELTANTESC